MVKQAKPKKTTRRRRRRAPRWKRLRSGLGRGLRLGLRGLGVVAVAFLLLVGLLTFVNPPLTHTMFAEWRRLGAIERQWVDADEIAPAMMRSVVAAEDANFCLHWGFDISAIRVALEDGARRGASTLSQQTVKNVFLWQGRSWARKALEALMTPVVEAVWSKRRILEVYLNVAEFGEGIFGIEAAAQHYYGIAASGIGPEQAARLALLLPNPRARDPRALPEPFGRAIRRVMQGAETIRVDGRSGCFES